MGNQPRLASQCALFDRRARCLRLLDLHGYDLEQ